MRQAIINQNKEKNDQVLVDITYNIGFAGYEFRIIKHYLKYTFFSL